MSVAKLQTLDKLVKRNIEERFSILSELDGITLSEALVYLHELNTTYKDAYFNVDYNYDSTYLEVCYSREETDKEFQKRVDAEKKADEKRLVALAKAKNALEKKERALLEKLKKKYEN